MNVIDYVKKNKNYSFKELKFNEIDALIFSLIPYIDFSNITKDKITIKEAASIIDLKKCHFKFNNKNKALFKELANSIRYQDIILQNYIRINNKTTQFGAITIIVPKHFKFIAFEGTEEELNGWEEDFRMGYTFPVPAQDLAIKYLNKSIKFNDILVYVGGHSKGGNLAVASLIGSKFKARIRTKYIFDFDGPGFLKDQIKSHKYKRILKKIKTYAPRESIVGMLMYKENIPKIVKSKAHNSNQHDSYNWFVNKNKFTQDKLSRSSINIHNRTIKLLEDYSKDERKLFADSLFKLLYKSGYTKKSDISLLNISSLKNVIKESKLLNDKEKEIIANFLKVLIAGK